ncbi:MAG TPA: hypothetical protein VHM48_07630 [Candidatus Limnocylindrales bacterium]|nr:hypothetical protein [Candidatus Limnocylindrales bacterium]
MNDGAPDPPATVRLGRWQVDRRLLVFIGLAVLARLAFWLITDRVWEDALITVTHARNAVAGVGLTHHPGEPVTHGFTSAVSVLIPLAGEIVVKGSGIFVLRVASILAAIATIVFADRICRRLGLGRWPTAMALLYLAFDQNQIFYGMAGMETQVAVAVLLWSVDAVMAGTVLRTGLSFGLAVLTRPDFLLWNAAATLDLGARDWRRAARIVVIGALVLAPWILFTTLYYGSPLPNTILAKSAHFVSPLPAHLDPASLVGWLQTALTDHVSALSRTFAPFYEDTLVSAAPLPLDLAYFVSILVWLLAILGAIRTWRIPGWRAAVLFAAAFTLYRVALLPGAYFDWYVPPHTAILIILAGAGVHSLRPTPRFDPRPILAVAVAVAFAIHTPFSLGMERKLQADIEVTVRTRVGQELAGLIRPGETLATESAGYYEYYSNATMLDYPGLTSVRARQAMQSLPPDHKTIIDFLDVVQADWMALRTAEWQGLQQDYPATAARYDVVDQVESPPGSIAFDADGRPRIEFAGYAKDASSWQIVILHRVR